MGELILAKAKELFFSYGLKSVSMDDLAKQAGISKKTIYQFYSDKDELINTIVDDLVQCHAGQLRNCQQNSKDVVDEVLKQSSETFYTWAAVNQAFFFELEKSFPDTWHKLEQHKIRVVRPAVVSNLEKGIGENIYRNLDVPFTADIRLQQLSTALQPASFTSRRLNIAGLANGLTNFYLHGITTEKGKKLLNKYLKNRNENWSNK